MRNGIALIALAALLPGCTRDKHVPTTNSGISDVFQEAPTKHDVFELAREAADPDTSTKRLHEIALQGESDPFLHEKIYGNESQLGRNPEGNPVLHLVASHANASPETLTLLANSRKEIVVSQALKNPKIPASVLARFRAGQNYRFDWGLAQNPKTPAAVLIELSASTNPTTREFVAANPATSPETLRTLSRDSELSVRRQILKNPKTPSETLARNPEIQKTAKNALLTRQGKDHRLTDTEAR